MKKRQLLLGASLLAVASARAAGVPWQPVLTYSVAAPSYTGPGDIVASATFWGGLRAYSAAVAATGTQKAINARRASDNATQDILILTSGALDVASALTFAGTDATGAGAITGTTLTFTGGHIGDTVAGGTVASGTYIVSGSSPTWTVNISQTVASATLTLTWGLYVTKVYDQSGNTKDAVQATAANQPQLIATGGTSGSLPYMLFAGNQYLSTASNLTAGTATLSYLAIRTSGFTTYSSVSSTPGSNNVGFFSSTNTVYSFSGTNTNATAADSAWHAVQNTFNGSSSVIYVDGSSTTVNPGASPAADKLTISGNGGQFLVGGINEIGAWGSVFSGANNAAMNSNQRAYWGF